MDTKALWSEISNDPLNRNYAGMADTEVANDLNTAYRTCNVGSVSGDEMFAATDAGEFAALTDHKQSLWMAFCGRAAVDPFASANVQFVQWIFPQGAITVSNLADLRTGDCSRAVELELGLIKTGHVGNARSVFGG